jgi:hypothetical protein
MRTREFPILDIQTHTEGLSEAKPGSLPWERCMLATWHQAAIDALALGYEHDMDTPAAILDGELVAIEDRVFLEVDEFKKHVPTPQFRRKAA